MSSSTSAEETTKESPTSSESESPSSTTKWDSFGRFSQNRWNKVRMLDHIRLMDDNQRLLDTALVAERAQRQQQHELRQSQMEQAQQVVQPEAKSMLAKPLEFPADALSTYKIDSPDTTHNYYTAPPAPPSAPTAQPNKVSRMWPLVAGAALATAGLGGLAAAGLGGYLLRPPSQGTTTTATQPGTVTPAGPLEGDEVTRERQPDGTMKETGRRRVRYLPDGTKEVLTDGSWKRE